LSEASPFQLDVTPDPLVSGAKGPVLSNVMDQRQGHKGLANFPRQNEAAIIKE